ncbi:hypothetical protein [Vibrio sp. H11]|uniref:hypothetical protein n=1 Tax=Vibrio sp. H11 TaxID=2565928 RepID=UPI0010A5F8A7|nr:hypothetical protein [Vibrio sp. H11]
MRNNALYFPYISIPESQWTIKTLLYWDKLSAIVPMDHIDNPEQLSPFMRALLERDLAVQIFPSQYLYEIPQFEQSFIRYLEPKVRAYRNTPIRRFSYAGRMHAEKFGSHIHQEKMMPVTGIHVEKMGELPQFLVEEGLADQVDGTWFNVDSRVANMFMAYLAICLGALNTVSAAPITSEGKYSNFLGHNLFRQRGGRFNHHQKAQDVVINNILPTPTGAIDLDVLAKFKMEHGHLLPRLRQKVESETAYIALLENADDRLDATNDFIRRCKEDTDEIIDAMKPSWSKVMFGSIAPLFGSGLAMVAAETGNKAAYTGAGLSFAATAYQALNSIRAERKRAEALPLAYIAHLRMRADFA